ncbi:class I SAM-dependent methyltransferase [Paralimibaculum aggregatum]|uniref:Class I SAM-dependent methyltransferase n=1 Tax=Paralimibaculum aggregatum TaxID=3036245 RepID=A0ABQ6LI72_9RHOB|nr:methyltransferase [Limibaculum sp. NKW23]GMG81352.1 class I SAM-dependent methyltransferase [Limibaculum sp. NKW23]
MSDQDDITEADLDALAEAYNAGLAHERAGDIAAAVAAFRRALEIDPADRGGVAVRLAALGEGPVPETAPPAYVATLFDQTAPRFDEILVEQLGYAVPMMLREMLEARGIGPVGRLLDLGCGTGLAGVALSDRAAEIVGVDLSEAMLDEAAERDCYDALYIGDAVAFLTGEEEGQEEDDSRFDMIVATDMLPYLGAVEALFAGAAACLVPGGRLAFSTERLPADAAPPEGYAVGPAHRFAHSLAYLEAQLAAAGFALEAAEPITVRFNEGEPVPGHLILARHTG